MLSDIRFLKRLNDFSKFEKDKINDETCELLEPYLSLHGFKPEQARNASKAAGGLCIWIGALKEYHEASKPIQAKLNRLELLKSRL